MSPAEQIITLRRTGRHEEACSLAVSLVSQHPNDAELQYHAASIHDFLGREAGAVPFYLAAIAGGLPAEYLRGAYVGLGSSYRVLGQYSAAEHTLREGLALFPDAAEIKTFLAMVLHNLGQSRQAIELLLTLLAQSSADTNIQNYREAILYYAKDINRSPPHPT
jgi:tetratricopeptide (TPR) repeat protein